MKKRSIVLSNFCHILTILLIAFTSWAWVAAAPLITTTLAVGPNPSVYGGTLLATVSPAAATGTVTFSENGAQLGGPVPLSGGKAALLPSAPIAVGVQFD